MFFVKVCILLLFNMVVRKTHSKLSPFLFTEQCSLQGITAQNYVKMESPHHKKYKQAKNVRKKVQPGRNSRLCLYVAGLPMFSASAASSFCVISSKLRENISFFLIF